MSMKRREFLATAVALNLGSAAALLANQAIATPDRGGRGARGGGNAGGNTGGRGSVQHGSCKTTKLFKSPGLYPNALAVMTDGSGGLWIGQQKAGPNNAYGVPVDEDPNEAAWLVDWNGKLVKTVTTNSRNTSGMAYGNGCVWMGANAAPWGIFQVDMNSRQ